MNEVENRTRAISTTGKITTTDRLAIYQEVARSFEGIVVTVSPDREDDMRRPLGENEVRVVIQGIQDNRDFWKQVAELEPKPQLK